MILCEFILPEELDDLDIRWLVLSGLASFDGVSALDIVKAAKAGTVAMYRVVGDAEGIFALENVDVKGKKYARIVALGGKGFVKHFQEVHQLILDTAKLIGNSAVMGFVQNPTLARLYTERTKAKQVASVFVEEIL